MYTVGVLALQGAFIEHRQMLDRLGVDSFEIRELKDIHRPMDGIIIPGGESTVIGRLLKTIGMFEPLKELIDNGLPVYGTCAGMILLAQSIDNDSRTHLATFPVSVKRNAYGRQLGSFYTDDTFAGKVIPMTYIRAPYISEVLSDDVEVLAVTDGNITAARYNNQLITAFHPELDDDTSVHEYFLNMIHEHNLATSSQTYEKCV